MNTQRFNLAVLLTALFCLISAIYFEFNHITLPSLMTKSGEIIYAQSLESDNTQLFIIGFGTFFLSAIHAFMASILKRDLGVKWTYGLNLIIAIICICLIESDSSILLVARVGIWFPLITCIIAFLPLFTVFLGKTLIQFVYWLLGLMAFILGIIGIPLPILPTTPFILLAAMCWAKASPQFHQWLYHHRLFGKMVQDWEKHRAVPRRAKYLAYTMMTISCLILLWRFPDNLWRVIPPMVICLATAIWMSRLPDAIKE